MFPRRCCELSDLSAEASAKAEAIQNFSLDPDHPSEAAHLWALTSASASNIAGVRSRRAIVRAPSRAATNAAAVEDARAGAKPHPLKCSATISVEINKSARDPFGQLSVERGQLIRQILHETSILKIRGDHFGRERAENLPNKIQSIARRIRRDIAQDSHSARDVMIDRFFCELCLAAWKVKVERSLGRTAFFDDLGQSGRRVALDPKQSFGRGNRASAGVSLTWHAANIIRFA